MSKEQNVLAEIRLKYHTFLVRHGDREEPTKLYLSNEAFMLLRMTRDYSITHNPNTWRFMGMDIYLVFGTPHRRYNTEIYIHVC